MSKPDQTRGKRIPHFATDNDAEHFLETADLSDYDLSQFKPMRFELRAKDARVNMRLPEAQIEAVKAAAAEDGVPYQRFIRDAIERALESREKAKRVAGKRAS